MQIPEIKTLSRAETLGPVGLDDPTSAYISYNDKYIIVFDFSNLGGYRLLGS